MTSAVDTGEALYPPTVTPPAEILPLGKFIVSLVKNPLLVLPQAAYEEPVVVREGTRFRRFFWACSPEIVEDILIKQSDIFLKTPVEKRVFRRTLRDGVISADGPLWRWQRRAMAPLFRPAEILKYVPAMAQPAEELLQEWSKTPKGELQNIEKAMTEITFSVIARTMLKGGEPSEADTIKRSSNAMLNHISWELMYGAFDIPLWLPHPASWLMNRAARRLRTSVQKIIERRQREESSGEDVLARLLQARDPDSGEPMDMERLVNNLLSLLEAGHETTARGLSWTLYLLARAPEWQERVRQEISSICGQGPIEGEHIAQLQLTRQVLKEAMRLYPPVPVMSRLAIKDTQIGEMDVEAGTIAIVPIFCIHRHKASWDDPARFDPTRFEPEKEAALARTQYMPFGAGPRVCLGNSFAMTEALVILATLIRGAHFGWDGKLLPEPVSRLTLRPRSGMRLKVELLDQSRHRYH